MPEDADLLNLENFTVSTFESDFAEDPDNLLQIEETLFSLELVENNTILRATLIEPIIEAFNADFSGEGIVDGFDLALWKSGHGANNLRDADADGDSDGIDFLIWQRQASAQPLAGAGATSVPEPSCVLLFGIAILGCQSRKRRLYLRSFHCRG